MQQSTGSCSKADAVHKLANWVAPTNSAISDGISVLAMPLTQNIPKATADVILAHADLCFDYIWVDNKRSCLNYNLMEAFSDKSCTYQHSQANPSEERVGSIAGNLKPAMEVI
jgi:hypothetical protein